MRGLDGLLVVQGDAERRDLGGSALAEPRAEPLKHPRPEVEHLLAAGDERLRDTHASAALDRLEADVDLGIVDAAAVREPRSRLPDGDPAELEGLALVDLEDAPVHAGLDLHLD